MVLNILVKSLASIAALFVLTKLMGNRQLSQMGMFDYINGITIGSIAAEFATNLERDWAAPLTAMIVYALVAALISYASCKSIALRRFFNGTPVVLYENGKLYEQNFLSAKLDISEFLTQCRTAGYFDLQQLQFAILETNGQISFLPKAMQRPVTPEDLQLNPGEEAPVSNIILDGVVMTENLKYSGKDMAWLNKELKKQSLQAKEVFLATVDNENTLQLYARTKEKVKREMFE